MSTAVFEALTAWWTVALCSKLRGLDQNASSSRSRRRKAVSLTHRVRKPISRLYLILFFVVILSLVIPECTHWYRARVDKGLLPSDDYAFEQHCKCCGVTANFLVLKIESSPQLAGEFEKKSKWSISFCILLQWQKHSQSCPLSAISALIL